MAIQLFVSSTASTKVDAAPFSVERRAFLTDTGAIGASLLVGFWSVPDDALAASAPPSTYRANPFITIASDDSVTLTMAKVEMGQGVYTSIPMLIAEELEVDLDKVTFRHAPPDAKTYGLPYGDQFTGGSSSIKTLWEPMRKTGAAARIVLIQAAANRWKVPAEACHAEHGEVVHKASGRRVKYGRLVAAASKLTPPDIVPLKARSEFKLIGKPAKRLDAKGKTDGTAVYGIDVVLPGMKFASVAASPVLGGTLKSVNEAKARALPGVRDVVKLENAVAVVADNTWYSRQGLAALDIVWNEGPNATLTTNDVRQLMSAALKKPGAVARNDGDAAKLLAADSNRVTATYLNPMLAHAAMEPINCTVHVQADRADIWVGTQVPARAHASAATLLGLQPEKVTLHNQLIGGAFGRRLYHDFIDQAVLIGKQVKGPVKVTWSREEDLQHDIVRGFYAHAVTATVDASGKPTALAHKIAGPSNLARFAPAFMNGDIDGDAVDGSVQLAYDIANLHVEHTREDGPIPNGFWRGVGATRNALVLESFIDELATRAGKDPLAYRLSLLSKSPRATNVLTVAAKKAAWGSPLAKRSGRGIALMYAWDTYLAQVVDLAVSESGEVTVQRVVCAVDCGVIVNPDTVVAQMQSGIVFGLSAALFGEITLKDGRVEQSNFHDYQVLRLNQSPRIDVELVQSAEPPGGIGEPGTAGVGAAFANAIYSATGERLYSLPVRPELLKARKRA